MNPARRHHESGFALIETLIATAIIAVMVALFAGIVARDGQATMQVAARREAILIARSALDQATAPTADLSLERGGENGALIWTIDVEPYGDSPAGTAPPLERISVTVRDRLTRRPLTRLSTLRFAA